MVLDRVTILGLIAIAAVLAIAHSPWWLLLAGAVLGWVRFDRWARSGTLASIQGPRGRQLSFADAVSARRPGYVIGDFLSAASHGHDGVLHVRIAQIAEIVRQCAWECHRAGHPSPPSVQVLEALEPWCAGCGLLYSPALLRQAWRNATAKGGIDLSPGPMPDADGHCPRCGSESVLLVFGD